MQYVVKLKLICTYTDKCTLKFICTYTDRCTCEHPVTYMQTHTPFLTLICLGVKVYSWAELLSTYLHDCCLVYSSSGPWLDLILYDAPKQIQRRKKMNSFSRWNIRKTHWFNIAYNMQFYLNHSWQINKHSHNFRGYVISFCFINLCTFAYAISEIWIHEKMHIFLFYSFIGKLACLKDWCTH